MLALSYFPLSTFHTSLKVQRFFLFLFPFNIFTLSWLNSELCSFGLPSIGGWSSASFPVWDQVQHYFNLGKFGVLSVD